jgi:hypothetical protein
MPRKHENMNGVIDWVKFGQRLGQRIKKTRASYRDLAEFIGVPGISYVTLHRVSQGRRATSAEVYLFLCDEFDIDPMYAYRRRTARME